MIGRVGFVGLGRMGRPMAINLLRGGYSVAVYNRTAEKARELGEMGAEVAASLPDVVEPGGVLVTMLSDDRAVEAVAGDQGLLQRLGSGGVHISMSTIAPSTSRRLAELHARFGVSYLAAPVFGRPEAAAAARLWIVTAGPSEALQRVRPLLDCLGRGTFYFGEDPGAANVVKLAGNLLIASAIQTIGEAVALWRKYGVDAKQAAALFTTTLFDCPIYQGYFDIILREAFRPAAFAMELGLKDISLVQQLGAEIGVPTLVADMLHYRMLSALARGRYDCDWSALALGVLEDAGLTG